LTQTPHIYHRRFDGSDDVPIWVPRHFSYARVIDGKNIFRIIGRKDI